MHWYFWVTSTDKDGNKVIWTLFHCWQGGETPASTIFPQKISAKLNQTKTYFSLLKTKWTQFCCLLKKSQPDQSKGMNSENWKKYQLNSKKTNVPLYFHQFYNGKIFGRQKSSNGQLQRCKTFYTDLSSIGPTEKKWEGVQIHENRMETTYLVNSW